MKKLLLTSAVLIAFHLGCYSDEFFVDNSKYKTLTDNTVELVRTYNDESIRCITVPEHISYNSVTYSVTSIGDFAFNNCYSFTSIILPNSVTSIGRVAFQNCSALTSITIPKSVISIGEKAFHNCYSLSSIIVENENPVYDSRGNCNAIIETKSNTLVFGFKSTTIPYGITSIGEEAFESCELTSITIPNSVTSIGENAFDGCSDLTSIIIPSSVTSIGKNVFSYCSSLTSITVGKKNPVYDSRDNCNAIIETKSNTLAFGFKSTTIPNTVTSIGKNAFSYCLGLTSIAIPNSVTSIGDSAFYSSYLTSITIPDGVTSIGNHAFDFCSISTITIPNTVTSMGEEAFGHSLTSVAISDGVTSIGRRTFASCSHLTSISISNSVTTIGEGAFSGCSSLTSITLPNSVTSIGDQAFYNCSGLKTITCYAAFPPEIYSNTFKNTSNYINVYVPCESIDDYKAIWKYTYFNFIKVDECSLRFTVGGLKYRTLTDNTVEVIGYDNANQIKVLELVRYNGVTYTVASIKNGALKDCKNLISAVVPNTMSKIGDYMFSGCSNLSSITIPNSITSIGEYSFSDCKSLKSIALPGSVKSIGKGAFSGSGLTSITIPNGVTSIEDYTFHGCLSSITIPNSVTSIGKEAFSNSGLTSITIPNSVTSIGDSTFCGCPRLTSITIPNGVTSIANYMFYGCSILKSINIPNGVTSIGTSAFSGCWDLSSITIPNSVTSIKDYAFSNCSGLTSISIPNSVTSIGSGAFYYCKGLTSITIPNSITSIGSGAFTNCTGLKSIIVEKENTVYDSRDNCNAIIETKSNILVFGFKNTTIPNSVTSIGDNAFYDCSGLTSLTIPNSVTSIGKEVFYNCSNLKSVTCYAAFPPDVVSKTFYNISKSIDIFAPCESVDYYRIYWDYFDSSAFRCIEATKVQTNTNSKVTPNATSAVIVWSVERAADRFKIAVTNNGNLVFTIYINSKGQITSIDYAEGGTRGAELRAATATYNGFKYEMIGLNPDTEYEYTVTTYDINDGVLRTDTGNFKTLKEIVGIEEETDNTNTLKEKLSINGKELTVSGTEPSDIKIYNTAGQQVGNPVPAAGVYVVKVGDETVKVLVK